MWNCGGLWTCSITESGSWSSSPNCFTFRSNHWWKYILLHARTWNTLYKNQLWESCEVVPVLWHSYQPPKKHPKLLRYLREKKTPKPKPSGPSSPIHHPPITRLTFPKSRFVMHGVVHLTALRWPPERWENHKRLNRGIHLLQQRGLPHIKLTNHKMAMFHDIKLPMKLMAVMEHGQNFG